MTGEERKRHTRRDKQQLFTSDTTDMLKRTLLLAKAPKLFKEEQAVEFGAQGKNIKISPKNKETQPEEHSYILRAVVTF